MAVVDIAGTAVLTAAQLAVLIPEKLASFQCKYPNKSIKGLFNTAAVGATNSAGSAYRLFINVPAGAIPLMCSIGNAGNVAGTSYSLGVYATSTGVAAAANCFANAFSMVAAHDPFSSPINGLSAIVPVSYLAPTIMQNAATGTGGGTVLAVTGASLAKIRLTGTVTAAGGCSVIFESSPDGASWTAISATNLEPGALAARSTVAMAAPTLLSMYGTPGAPSTNSGLGWATSAPAEELKFQSKWLLDLTANGGIIQVRARVSAYTAGSITAKGWLENDAALWQYALAAALTTAAGYDIVLTANTAGSGGDTVKGLLVYAL